MIARIAQTVTASGRSLLLVLPLLGAACSDHDTRDPSVGAPPAPAPAPASPAPVGTGTSTSPTTTPASAPLYAVFTSVETPEGAHTYLGLTDSLERGTLDPKQSLEAPEASRFYAPEGGGFFAIGSGEDYTITRYDVSADRKITETGKVSFAELGVTRLHYRAVFLSPTKAYYIDHTQGQIVVWNPATMTLTGKLDLPDEVTTGFEGFKTVLPYFQYPVVNGKLFIPVAWEDTEAGVARGTTGLAVVDTATDQLLSFTVTDRCPAATELAFDDNGDVYYGTNVNYPAYAYADPARRGTARDACILRIKAGEVAFDPSYRVRVADLVGGGVGMGLCNAAEPGFGYVQAIDENVLAWSTVKDEDTFWETPAWAWWRIDLAAGKAVRDTALPLSAPFIKSFQVDGSRYIVRQSGESSSSLFRLSATGEHVAGFSAPGQIAGIARVR
ncbi:MAG: hypothetical protein ABW252_15740 [Polyangiales bacterium]